ncbi:MAG: DUF4351 domain-containing protein [Prochlorotrichaceae cyanobacterium]
MYLSNSSTPSTPIKIEALPIAQLEDLEEALLDFTRALVSKKMIEG